MLDGNFFLIAAKPDNVPIVAMIFLLFDIEVAFLYPWAIALRDLGWAGFVQVVLFMTLLLTGYVYVWRKGVLDWGHS